MLEIIVILLALMILADQVEITLWEIANDRRMAEVRRKRSWTMQ